MPAYQFFNLDSVFKVFSRTWTWSTVNYADLDRFGESTKREWSSRKHEKAKRLMQVPNLTITQTTDKVIK